MVIKIQIIFNPIQAQAFRYDYFMKRKQEKENKLREVYNYISDNKTLTQNVLWNAKNIDRDAAHNYNLQKKKFETQQEIFLDQRRKKLSERLNQEEAMYHQELINNQESPEDVRRRMEIKLKELREQRLNDREENVEKLQEKRLYEVLDELRKNYSEVFAFAFKQNEKAIKYNQDIDKLEKEKLKEQWKRDELKEKKYYNSNKIKNIQNMS